MDSQFTSNKVLLLSIEYCAISREINYYFWENGVEHKLKGRMHDGEIRGVEYSDELDDFIMSLMPRNEKVSKVIFSISWAFVDGEKIKLPVALT